MNKFLAPFILFLLISGCSAELNGNENINMKGGESQCLNEKTHRLGAIGLIGGGIMGAYVGAEEPAIETNIVEESPLAALEDCPEGDVINHNVSNITADSGEIIASKAIQKSSSKCSE